MEWHEYLEKAMQSKQARKVLCNRGHSMFVFVVVIRLCFENDSGNTLLKDIRALCPTINGSSLFRSLESLAAGGLIRRWKTNEPRRGWTTRYAPGMNFTKRDKEIEA
jgi:hypothetical protein